MILDVETLAELNREIQKAGSLAESPADKQLVVLLSRILTNVAELECKVDNNFRILKGESLP